jgi:hypothetical protein
VHLNLVKGVLWKNGVEHWVTLLQRRLRTSRRPGHPGRPCAHPGGGASGELTHPTRFRIEDPQLP